MAPRTSYADRKAMALSLGFDSVSARDRLIRANRAAAGVFDKSDPAWKRIADETDAAQAQMRRDSGVAIDEIRAGFIQKKEEAKERRDRGRKQIHAGGDLVSTTADGGGTKVFLSRLKQMGAGRVSLIVDTDGGKTIELFLPRGWQARALRKELIHNGAEADLMRAVYILVMAYATGSDVPPNEMPVYVQVRKIK